MVDLLRVLVEPLVNHPDQIDIVQTDRGQTVILELRVNPDDMGKVIGRGGRRAQAIRNVMKAKAKLYGKRLIVDIVD